MTEWNTQTHCLTVVYHNPIHLCVTNRLFTFCPIHLPQVVVSCPADMEVTTCCFNPWEEVLIAGISNSQAKIFRMDLGIGTARATTIASAVSGKGDAVLHMCGTLESCCLYVQAILGVGGCKLDDQTKAFHQTVHYFLELFEP